VPEAPPVVFAHGLWNTGLEATLLRLRLAAQGFQVTQFHYRTVTALLHEVLDDLRGVVLERPTPVHLVGHSLGGLVILRLVDEYPELPIGRIVLLGAPVNGSATARAAVQLPGAALLFGPLADAELLRPAARRWCHRAEIGIIAGSNTLSFSRLFNRLPEPNDGTVTVEETRLEGATEHLVLPVSHTGMLLAPSVVEQTAAFLGSGRFSRADA
jgi:pimeloyl-ACP methyl ester carboxylesterase